MLLVFLKKRQLFARTGVDFNCGCVLLEGNEGSADLSLPCVYAVGAVVKRKKN